MNCVNHRSLLGWVALAATGCFLSDSPLTRAANSNPTVTFNSNTNQTNSVGSQFQLQLFQVSNYTNLPNLFITNQTNISSTTNKYTNIFGNVLTIITNTCTSTNRFSNNLVTFQGSAFLNPAISFAVGTMAGSPAINGTNNGSGLFARFGAPAGLALDRSTNLYVADSGNNRIRKINRFGVVTTLTNSNGVIAITNPAGLAVDSATNLYVANRGNGTITRITPAGAVSNLTDSNGTTLTFSNPAGVAVDGATNIYVADSGNNRIRKITPAGLVTNVTNSGMITITNPAGLALDSSTNLYVANGGSNSINRISPAGTLTTLATNINGPCGLAVDSSRNVYVAAAGTNAIIRISSSGEVGTLAGMAGVPGFADGSGNAAQFNSPWGVAVSGAFPFTAVYVADQSNNIIRNITGNGLTFDPATGSLEGAPRTNFVLSLSNQLVVLTTNRTWGLTNIQTNRIITTISNGFSTSITNSRFEYGSWTNLTSSTQTNSTTNTNPNSFRLVFQSTVPLNSFPVTTVLASGSTNLPITNDQGLEYSYTLVSGNGSLTFSNGTNVLTAAGVEPIVLRVSLAPPSTNSALQIWLSNSAVFTVTPTNPPAAGFAWVTNTNSSVYTRTNLSFSQITPLVVTNEGLLRTTYAANPGSAGLIFFSNHPLYPNLQLPFLQALTGTGSISVQAVLPATATSGVTTSSLSITLTQAPTPLITMFGVFSSANINPVGGTYTNSNPPVTNLPLLASSSAGYRVGFSSSDTNVARAVTNGNTTTLVMVSNGTCNILATNLFLDTNNYDSGASVTNTLVVDWTAPQPVFKGTNRADGMEGMPFGYLISSALDTNAFPLNSTNAFPVVYGATNLPPGLVFDGTNRILGYPTKAGYYQSQLTAANSAGIATNILTSVIEPAVPFSVTNPWSYQVALGTGTNTNGAYLFSTNGSNGPFAAGNLPAGIGSVTNSNNTTPPALVLTNANTNPSTTVWFAGMTNLAVVFSNSLTNFTSSVSINVRPTAPTLNLTSVITGRAGDPGAYLRAAEGVGPSSLITNISGYPLTFGAADLPMGLTLDTGSGVVAGTPVGANTPARIWVSNALGRSSTSTVSVNIMPVAGLPLRWSLAFTNAAGTYQASNLPAGLTFSPSSGILSGSPLGSLTSAIKVVFTPGTNRNLRFTNTTNFIVAPALPAFTSSGRQDGKVGADFNYLLVANTVPVQFGVTNLPPGLVFTNLYSSSSNTIQGKPTQAGTYRIQMTASNAAGSVTNILTSMIEPAVAFSVTNPWSYQVALGTGTNTNGFYTVGNLPVGIGSNVISSTSGPPLLVLTNTNLSAAHGFAGITNLSVVFSNSQSTLTSSVALNVQPGPPGLALPSPVVGKGGAAFSTNLAAGVVPSRLTNVPGYPLVYLASNLPAGLSLNRTSGVVDGKPEAGTGIARFWVTNSNGVSSTNEVAFNIQPVAGVPLRLSLAFTNGPGTYRAGSLPPGLSLVSSNGLMVGSPQAVGSFDISLAFIPAGSNSPSGTNTTNLTILPPPPVLVLPTQSLAIKAGQPFLLQPWVTGPGWGWAGADSLTNPAINTAVWTGRLASGNLNLLLSSNSNGCVLASSNGLTFTNNTHANTNALLWVASLPSSTPWQALVQMRVTNTNPLLVPFLGIFQAPANYATNYAEGFLQASNTVLAQASFGNTGGVTSGGVVTNSPGTNEVAMRLSFDATNQKVTIGVNTNLTTNLVTNLLTSTNLRTSWGLNNPSADFRLWLGGDFSSRTVSPGEISLRNFALLPGGLAFSAVNLPPGLVCDPETGTLRGIPAVAPARYTTLLSVTNEQGSSTLSIDFQVVP